MRALVFLAALQSLATTAFAAACAMSETLMMNWPLVFGLILADVCFMAYIAAERNEEAVNRGGLSSAVVEGSGPA